MLEIWVRHAWQNVSNITGHFYLFLTNIQIQLLKLIIQSSPYVFYLLLFWNFVEHAHDTTSPATTTRTHGEKQTYHKIMIELSHLPGTRDQNLLILLRNAIIGTYNINWNINNYYQDNDIGFKQPFWRIRCGEVWVISITSSAAGGGGGAGAAERGGIGYRPSHARLDHIDIILCI